MTLELAKGIKSILSKDPAEQDDFRVPPYTEEEKTAIRRLQSRLEAAALERNQTRDEFDGLDYISYWWAIENAANTTIKKAKEKGEPDFRSGTLRTKMFAFLNSYQALNLGADITAFNKNDEVEQRLGDAMEDIIEKIKYLDNDEELRVLRQYEMMKHGYVFVETNWIERWVIEKKVTSGKIGQVSGFKWDTKKKKASGRPERNIIAGPGVYLGNIRQYFIEKQPFIFTVETKDWTEAEKIYGEWERWKYVSKEKRNFTGETGNEMVENAWRLLNDPQKGQVEIIKYQDKPNNEFQIIINGVPMLPMGFPLSEVSPGGEYTIAQQNLEPIRFNFAYGKSFIFKNKNIVALLDTMMKLAALKTYKSFLPPMINMSSRVISKNVLMPAKISRGISKGDLVPIYDNVDQGVTNAEFNMINEVREFINENTVSPTFHAAKEEGGKVTATQIIELQRQARLMMGLTVLAATLLEKKLDTKLLMILLEHWFDPVDEVVDEIRDTLVNKYRVVSRERTIEGEGRGVRMVIPSEEEMTAEDIKILEEQMKEKTGKPTRIIMINPEALKRINLTWQINVTAREKETSEYSKVLFGAMVQDAQALGLRLNIDWTEEEFARVWERDPAKMFSKGAQAGTLLGPEQGGGIPTTPATPAPKIKGPEIESIQPKPRPAQIR